MIILPTEKRFQWSKPPVILCLLIILNILVFFFYQANDNEQINQAINEYLDADLLGKEWKVYQDFLSETGQTAQAQDITQAYRDNQDDYLAYTILADKQFSAHLEAKARSLYGEDDYQDLLATRQQASRLLMATSALRFGLIPNEISIITLLSSQFLHGDFMHLLGNLFFLVVCGFAVEAAIGHGRFLLFYLLSGMAGGLAHAALDFSSNQPLIGASAAISGVMAMYLWIFRLKQIEFFYWFYLFVGYVRLPALMVLPLYIGQEILQYFSHHDSNVAFMAHAGGFAAASVLMGGLLVWKPHTLDDIYIEENHSIDPCQQKLAEVYQAMENGQFPLALKHLQDMTETHKETFRLSLLQYHLMKTPRHDDLPATIKKVLAYTKLNPAELRRQEQVWLDNADLYGSFHDDDLINLGMRFSALDDMSTAEKIYALLKEKGSNHNMMGVFARKLAINFEKMKNREKATHYTQMADAFLQGDQA